MAHRKKASSARARPVLLSGGNPQIAKADGDAPVPADACSPSPATIVTDWRETNLLASRFWPKRGFKPVFVRITYEVDQGGEQFWVAGVDAQVMRDHPELNDVGRLTLLDAPAAAGTAGSSG